MTKKSFSAGAAKIIITPPLGTRINGDFIAHYATLIHDELYSKALVLKTDRETIAFVVVDICSMPQEFIADVKSTISIQTGIPTQHILISSTHTHAAGSIEEVYMGGIDIAYRKKLPQQIVLSVQEALKNLRPAKFAFGKTNVPEHVLCRRYYMNSEYQPRNAVSGNIDEIKTNPFGLAEYIDHPVSLTDPELSFFLVKGLDDRWISILGNYSLHYVGDWDDGTITADYYGTFSEHLKGKLNAGDDFVAMMSNGTSGDINIWDFQNPGRYPSAHFSKSEYIGNDLAEKLIDSITDIRWENEPEIRVKYDYLDLSVRKPPEKELARAAEIVQNSQYESYTYDDEHLRSIYAREQILLNELPDKRTAPLQVIKIGDLIIGGLSGEFFAETGRWLKKHRSSEQYFTIGLANGNVGYVPPVEELKRGGYETWRSRYSCLEEEAEEKIKQKVKRMSEELLTV